MFTGIVDHIGTIRHFEQHSRHAVAHIESKFSNLIVGESIAVDGMCLTVTEANDRGEFRCDISIESLAKTIAEQYRVGSHVNLERALAMGDRLGGHWVTGHVDRVLEIRQIKEQDQMREVVIAEVEGSEAAYLIPKGSIAINGVSLTVNAVHAKSFSLLWIPHTLSITNLRDLKEGSRVNVEFDWLAKAVARSVEVFYAREN